VASDEMDVVLKTLS